MAGTLEWVKIDGISYYVMAETDGTATGGPVEATPIAHTGGSTPKKVRRTDSKTGIILHVNDDENDRLRAIVGVITNLSYAKDGRVYRSRGFISHNGYTNQDNAATVDLHSTSPDGFVLF